MSINIFFIIKKILYTFKLRCCESEGLESSKRTVRKLFIDFGVLVIAAKTLLPVISCKSKSHHLFDL